MSADLARETTRTRERGSLWHERPHKIYLITGPDGVYVGVTSCSPWDRWRQHLRAARVGNILPLYTAIRAHGESAFRVRVVAESLGIRAALDTERNVITQLLLANAPVYNCDPRTQQARSCLKDRARLARWASLPDVFGDFEPFIFSGGN